MADTMYYGDEEVVKVEPQPCDDDDEDDDVGLTITDAANNNAVITAASAQQEEDEAARLAMDDLEAEEQAVAARNQCHICMEQFALEKQYVEHMFAVHGVQRPFRCHDCGKCLSYRSSLYNHRKIHSDKRPWACDWCPAKFIWSNRCGTCATKRLFQFEISRAACARPERRQCAAP